ncbi:UbiD family decarboxylase domain-containing protein [Chloroflexota bacterium]
MGTMENRDISNFRSTLEYLQQKGELLTAKDEVDTIYEVAGIQKAMENGPALMLENIKDYPGTRIAGNMLSREQRVADIFGIPEYKDLKFKFHEAINNPLPPKIIENAPCQEVVIKDNMDVTAILPLIKHSEVDAGRILGGGIILSSESDVTQHNDISFKRMHFRGKDWCSVNIVDGTHLSHLTHKKGRTKPVPITINISTSPSVIMVAGTSTVHTIMPAGTNELGIAGAFQGFPVELCKAKTIDAYAIADSEWVLEGYVSTESVWESEEAEKLQKRRVAPYFPEWSGYLGRASTSFKLHVSAITHRQDRPIFYTPLADSYEFENMGNPLREACLYELAQRIAPGLIKDVNILHAFKSYTGMVFQVQKRRSADDAFLRNIAAVALPAGTLRMAIFVDEDVNIYNADDVLWAIATRANMRTDVFTGAPGSIGLAMLPFADMQRDQESWSEGGMVIDATVPFRAKTKFPRSHYPVERVELKKWFTAKEIASVKAQQSEYARFLAEIGG